MRRAAKVDRNQQEIVSALREAGYLCLPLHRVGHGCPDLLVLAHGRLRLLELKSLGGRLTQDELAFAAAGWPVKTVWTPGQALVAVGANDDGVEVRA